MKLRTALLSIPLLFCLLGQAQIRDVKSRASSYKSNSSSSSDSNTSSWSTSSGDAGGLFLLDVFTGLMDVTFSGLYHAHQNQLQFKDIEDWRTGWEFGINGGLNYNEVNFFNSQFIRGNHGLFSTQFRRFDVSDVSGSFTTLDWQILQLNLINLEKVRWVAGAGISHETEIDQTHFEFATEFSFTIGNKLKPTFGFRRSDDGYPRKEFSSFLTYRPFYDKKAEVNFSVGYVHQKLYDIPFNLIGIGIGLNLK